MIEAIYLTEASAECFAIRSAI